MSHYLNSYSLSHYLVDRNDNAKIPSLVCEGGANEQHAFFKAEWSDGEKWFIKQPFDLSSQDRFGIKNEAMILQMIADCPDVLNYSPKLIHFNPLHKILISEDLQHYNAIDSDSNILKPSILLGGNLLEESARMMQMLHNILTNALQTSKRGFIIHNYRPFILSENTAIIEPIINNFRISSISKKWLSDIFTSLKLRDVIKQHNDDWKNDTLIHGDATFQNVLFFTKDCKQYSVKICDWEFSGWGDVNWDIASFFQGLLICYMNKKINLKLLLKCGERFYNAYVQNSEASNIEEWFVKILRLSALNIIERLLTDSINENPANELSKSNDELAARDTIEYLINKILINPHVLSPF